MASVEHAIPPPAAYDVVPPTSRPTATPMPTRQDSIMTVDMHIPGAWNGTNPSTPQPITEDMKYFGEKLRTVPSTVQSYMPPKEKVAATGSTILHKAAAMVPASVMNTATNVLPKSMQPTMSPTAADAKPPAHPTDVSNDHPITTTTNTIRHKELDTSRGEAPPAESTAGSTLKDKAASILPASVVGAATSYLPTSVGGKAAPSDSTSAPTDSHPATKALDEPAAPTTATPSEAKPTDENQAGTTWAEKAKSILPVGAIGAAAAYLPSALSPSSASKEEQDAQAPAGPEDQPSNKVSETKEVADAEKDPNAAPLTSSDNTKTASGFSMPTAPVIGSTVSPDEDVQEALRKAANPEEYKTEVIPPMHFYPSAAPSLPHKDDQTSIESTKAIGGTTPMTLNSSEAEGDGYLEKHDKGVSGPAAAVAGGGVGAMAGDHSRKQKGLAGDGYPAEGRKGISGLDTPTGTSLDTGTDGQASEDQTNLAGDRYTHGVKNVSGLAALAGVTAVDHGLKDQRNAAVRQREEARPHDNTTPQDSFMHVVIPATPGAVLHEQEKFDKKHAKSTEDGALATPEKHKKRDRSGSISTGEASPSSPSKSGMFSGIRKLTKKRDRSASKGHDRNVSTGDAAPHHGDSLDTRDSNSTDHSPTHGGEEKRERNVLHKDPPAHHAPTHTEGDQSTSPTTANNEGNDSTSKRDHDPTPSMLANPFSPNSPPSSPSKVGFREKVKGEFMVVQGKLTRDEGLKEAGEKMKKGTF